MTDLATQTRPEDELKQQIHANSRFLGTLLKADDAERGRFTAEIVQAVRANPKLLNASRNSLLFAIGEAAAAGLSVNPNMGEAWLIPRNRRYKDSKGKWQTELEVNFQPGYKGLVKIAYRSGLISRIYTNVAYIGERYLETGGCNPNIVHEPDHEKRTDQHKDVTVAYAVVWLKGSADPMFESLGHAKLVRIAESSGNPQNKDWSNVWRDHFGEMARKSALSRLCKILPRQDELRALHLIVERDAIREVGGDPQRLDVLDGLQLPSSGDAGLNSLVGARTDHEDEDQSDVDAELVENESVE